MDIVAANPGKAWKFYYVSRHPSITDVAANHLWNYKFQSYPDKAGVYNYLSRQHGSIATWNVR